MGGVFISYRREDCAGHAGRLFDRLVDRFGERGVFMDIDAIEPGVDFGERIAEAVGSCSVLLALIGDEWLDVVDAGGARRLDDPADFVRVEVASALGRAGLRVIPVLVEGAKMPRAEQLPDDLKPLVRRNAFELSDARWRYDADRLVEVVERVSSPPSPRSSTAGAGAAAGRSRVRVPLAWRRPKPIAAALAALVVLAAATAVLVSGDDGASHRTVALIGPLPLDGVPGRPAVSGAAVWVPMPEENAVRRIDIAARTRADVPNYDGKYPIAAAAHANRIWIADALSDEVKEIDVASRRVIHTYPVGDEPKDIVYAYGYVWTVNCACGSQKPDGGTVSRINPATAEIKPPVRVGAFPHGIGAGDGYIWAATEHGVRRVDPDRDVVEGPLIAVGDYPTDVAVDANGVWVSIYREHRLARIDPSSFEYDVKTSIAVGERPWTLAVGGGYLWVAHEGDGSLRRIDTRHRTVAKPMFLDAVTPQTSDPGGDGVIFGAGRAWLASRRAGGTLRGVPAP